MKGKIESFKDLAAWQKSMDLVEAVYRLSHRFPGDERFGLTSQVRRAAVSIPSNIAEGYGRRNPGDYVRFLQIARGSANEVETQLLIAVRLGMVDQEAVGAAVSLCDEVQRIVNGLATAVSASPSDPRR